MSLAPQNQTPDITDALDGSLSNWYENVNNCLKLSECIPGKYEYSAAASYGNQCPIQDGGSTQIDISCNRFEVIDIDNSYIDFTFTAPITVPPQIYANEQFLGNGTIPPIYYVGWKSSYDLIEEYRIYSNGDNVFPQKTPHYESFINYISLTDSAKEKSPCYSTQAKIQRMDQNVPGVYIQLNNIADAVIPITIRAKIPLNAFPFFAQQKYYPGFFGRTTIEIFPSYKNLIWELVENGSNFAVDTIGQINPKPLVQNAQLPQSDVILYYEVRGGPIAAQINTECCNRAYEDTQNNNVIKWDPQTFSCSSSTLTEFKLYLAKYMIKMDVYNALEMNYLQVPLLFPIQTVSAVKFTYPMGASPQFTLQNTATLSHCDTIFIVFPLNSNERTISINPEISAHLHINGTYYPREELSTNGNDVRFTNLFFDAININNNPLMTPGEDIMASIRPYKTINRYDTVNGWSADLVRISNGDRTNFAFAVPLSTNEDFMGGISSNGQTVQIELIGSRDALDPTVLNTIQYNEAPVAIFLQDDILKMYAMKPPGKPQISITHAELPQIIASGGAA